MENNMYKEHAIMIASYVKNMQEQGFSRQEAIQLAIAHQDSLYKCSVLRETESHKNMLQVAHFGGLQ